MNVETRFLVIHIRFDRVYLYLKLHGPSKNLGAVDINCGFLTWPRGKFWTPQSLKALLPYWFHWTSQDLRLLAVGG
jgi:hypothetical protein